MKALVFGSTGLVGSGLMRLLVQSPQYTEIVSFVRRKSDIVPNKVKEIQSDLKNLSSFRSEFDCETVFVTLGTTIKKAGSQEKFREVDYTFPLSIAELAKESGVRSFLMVSSIGADPNSSVFYSKVKGEVERDTISLNLPSLYIFRPSLLLGHRSEFRLGEKIGEIFSAGISFAFLGPLKKYKPIESEVVASSMLLHSLSPVSGVHILESDLIVDSVGD